MNTPPLLLGLALLFWGWQADYLAVGAVLGVLVESPRLLSARWHFSQSDFDRLWNISAVLCVGAAAYLFINEGAFSLKDFIVDAGRRPDAIRNQGQAALLWFRWFPMIFFPFAIAAAFSESPLIDVSTFSWFLRKRRNLPGVEPSSKTNVGFPYFAVILLSATATNRRDPLFYFALCALVGWGLWSQRTRRYPALAWLVMLAGIVVAGHFSHRGIAHIERVVDGMNLTWLSRLAAAEADSGRTPTMIGTIGRLKLSNKIVLRLRTHNQPPPPLIREASYNIFGAVKWLNSEHRTWTQLYEETTNSTTWVLLTNRAPRQVNIAHYLRRGSGIILVPTGTARLDELPVTTMKQNSLGMIRADGGPGLVIYDTHYDESGLTHDAAPVAEDYMPARTSEPAVAQVATQLGLRPGMPIEEAMRLVSHFFAQNFSYTSYLTASHEATSNETALARFLLKERTGHCEYYATATTLLLRRAGIATRYAVGYSVQEGNGGKYVVREKHAHAWTMVFDGTRWRDFDTTPGSWNALENHGNSWYQGISDFFSDVWFQFSKWRWSSTEWRTYLLWIPIPLAVIAVGSFFLKKQWTRLRPSGDKRVRRRDWPGLDSDFYAVEKAFRARGFDRLPNEPWKTWLQRIQIHPSLAGPLESLVVLHSKYRFDPKGLTAEERAALRASTRACMAELKRAMPARRFWLW